EVGGAVPSARGVLGARAECVRERGRAAARGLRGLLTRRRAHRALAAHAVGLRRALGHASLLGDVLLVAQRSTPPRIGSSIAIEAMRSAIRPPSPIGASDWRFTNEGSR